MGNYLYNGVELHALPERDEEQYRFAFIKYGYDYTPTYRPIAQLYFTSEYDISVTEQGATRITLSAENTLQYTCYTDDLTEWEQAEPPTSGFGLEYIKWTNTDLYTTDGTLYLAASEPVPIVPTPPSPQTAFCIGKAFGRLIRNAMKPQ